MPLSAHFEELSDIAALEPRWRAMEAAAGTRGDTPSFFLGWTWIGSWLGALEAVGIALPCLLAVADEGARDVALALIGQGRVRRKLGSVPALWLNESGTRDGDRPFIEYNGLLCRAGAEAEAARALCEALAHRHHWSVLHLSGVAGDCLLADVAGARRRVVRDVSPAYHVDLAAVRDAGGDYLALLSSNTRSQIRRSLKEEAGPPGIEVAADAATVAQWLAEMRRLNTGRHADNAWDNAFFCDFARRITLAGLANGSVELLRIGRGGEPIGYLLNFIQGGRAMNYQSAFAEPRTAKSKPGLMAHAAAVARYAERGLALYSLLAGKDRYKQSLSTGAEELHWWTVERFDLRLEAEALLRRLMRK